ncbi:MAG: hypothetical protein H6843_08310 [Rhodospirillaceae bacterium]|nr:hypothetical protein [Rhodospirillaceae bacterium]
MPQHQPASATVETPAAKPAGGHATAVRPPALDVTPFTAAAAPAATRPSHPAEVIRPPQGENPPPRPEAAAPTVRTWVGDTTWRASELAAETARPAAAGTAQASQPTAAAAPQAPSAAPLPAAEAVSPEGTPRPASLLLQDTPSPPTGTSADATPREAAATPAAVTRPHGAAAAAQGQPSLQPGAAPPLATQPLPLFAPVAGAPPAGLPSLPEALTALAHADPGTARQITQTVLPQANAGMGAAVLFFLSALRGGDLRGWLGDRAVKSLEAAGKGDAVGRLSGEFSGLSRQAADTPAGDWRQVGIPIVADGQVSELRLATRHQQEDGTGEDELEGEGHRFVLDMETSRFGPVQLDGLIRQQAIRLVVRTAGTLPGEVRHGITRVFGDAVAAIGHDGILTFQTGTEAWLQLARRDGGRLRISRPQA